MKNIVTIITLIVCSIVSAVEMDQKDFNAAVNTAVTEIVKHEGFHSSWYKCPAGELTIGHGLTKAFWNKPTITKEESLAVVKQRADAIGKEVLSMVQKPLTSNQLAALISFTYNVGIGNFQQSTLLKELNKGNYSKVPAELKRWVYSKKVKLNGLVARRASEAALWSK